MRAVRAAVVATACGILIAAAPVVAHHSFTQFDQAKTEKVTGEIVKVELTNPHAWIWIDAKDDKGQVVKWGFEGGSVRQMYNAGYTRDNLKVGVNVTVEHNPAKDGSQHGSLRSMTFPDGQKFGRGFGGG